MIQRKHLILLSLVGAIISFDQLLKTLTLDRFLPGQKYSVLPRYFNVVLVRNPGAAFGLLSNLDPHIREPLFTLVPIITIAVVLFVFQRLTTDQKLNVYALSAIVGGAIENLIDRARLGYVIDFLDFHFGEFYHFPAFNIADSAITVGIGLLFLALYLDKNKMETN